MFSLRALLYICVPVGFFAGTLLLTTGALPRTDLRNLSETVENSEHRFHTRSVNTEQASTEQGSESEGISGSGLSDTLWLELSTLSGDALIQRAIDLSNNGQGDIVTKAIEQNIARDGYPSSYVAFLSAQASDVGYLHWLLLSYATKLRGEMQEDQANSQAQQEIATSLIRSGNTKLAQQFIDVASITSSSPGIAAEILAASGDYKKAAELLEIKFQKATDPNLDFVLAKT